MLSVFIGGFLGNLLSHFLSDYFAVSKFCHTFVAVNEFATTYQHNISMQRILKFFASFCADYLVNPNNLLTHTHTHTQAHLASNSTFFALSYARAKRGVSPINKGLSEVPFVRFFMPFSNCPKKDISRFCGTQKNSIQHLLKT